MCDTKNEQTQLCAKYIYSVALLVMETDSSAGSSRCTHALSLVICTTGLTQVRVHCIHSAVCAQPHNADSILLRGLDHRLATGGLTFSCVCPGPRDMHHPRVGTLYLRRGACSTLQHKQYHSVGSTTGSQRTLTSPHYLCIYCRPALELLIDSWMSPAYGPFTAVMACLEDSNTQVNVCIKLLILHPWHLLISTSLQFTIPHVYKDLMGLRNCWRGWLELLDDPTSAGIIPPGLTMGEEGHEWQVQLMRVCILQYNSYSWTNNLD